MKQLCVFISLLFCSICNAEQIFVIAEPYHIQGTDYTNSKVECQPNEDCIQFVWYSEYKLKNVISLSSTKVDSKITVAMASHTQRYRNGSAVHKKWLVELVPINHKSAKYEVVSWSSIEEIVCTEKPLTNGSNTLKSYWKTLNGNNLCYYLEDLTESKKIQSEQN